jgi:hypothetical protein
MSFSSIMGDPRPIGVQSVPPPRFRVVPGPDDNRMSSYNRPQRPNIRPNVVDNNNQYVFHQQDNNNFQRPNVPPRMAYQVRQGIPLQRMQQMNINQRMSPSMMMPPPQSQQPQQPQQQQQQHHPRPQMQQQQQTSESEPSEEVKKEKLVRIFRTFCNLCNKANKSNIPTLLNLIEV